MGEILRNSSVLLWWFSLNNQDFEKEDRDFDDSSIKPAPERRPGGRKEMKPNLSTTVIFQIAFAAETHSTIGASKFRLDSNALIFHVPSQTNRKRNFQRENQLKLTRLIWYQS